MAENFWFKARYSWGSGFSVLNDTQVANLARAIWKLASDGEDTNLSGIESALWCTIREEIIRDTKDRENGKKGGRPPFNPGYNPPSTEQSISEHIRAEQRKAKQTPKGGEGGEGGEGCEGFKRFYKAYPRHEGKQAALRAWEKLAPSEELQAAILSAVEVQKQSQQWTRDNGQYIPLPASWLNGRRWEDETHAQYAGLNLGVTL